MPNLEEYQTLPPSSHCLSSSVFKMGNNPFPSTQPLHSDRAHHLPKQSIQPLLLITPMAVTHHHNLNHLIPKLNNSCDGLRTSHALHFFYPLDPFQVLQSGALENHLGPQRRRPRADRSESSHRRVGQVLQGGHETAPAAATGCRS